MIHEVFMPALSSTMTEGKITAWLKSPGDKVKKGETVLVVESDKADMDVESFYDGYLGQILVPAGSNAPVGAVLAYIADTEAELQNLPSASPANTTTTPAKVAVSTEVATTATVEERNGERGRVIASPRAKKLAKEQGVDLATIVGTGPHGRITAADVLQSRPPEAAKVVTAPPSVPVATAPATKAEVKPLTTLQQAVVRNMNASLEVPVFYVGYTITTTALDRLYKQVKSKGVTMTVLLAKAAALTLQKHPIINAYYTDRGIAYRGEINIAVAVAMEDGGLITPVLKDADKTDIYSLGRQWQSLVERARQKQLQPQEYTTGTFTISNLGMYGVDRFTAILPPGTGAILAVGASQPRVVATPEGAIIVRTQMEVNLTCDHRTIYGAQAAQFLKDLADLIENQVEQLTL
ncbi:MAG: dihydrolipoamide acetyltransferase family protein [Pseudanabaenaceae cyanobacterium SKYGB_i_bin29]|nr:2-oxo acid dehydrogenase subunit E2 [Pseudanabaenaceae cyanobacterium SKYG29]MDW8422673.1 dihydrolipoamide acetyltransferase family protein [Pseudanabaenaceae cyanobacterium SKYGB_i_bin29]